MKKLLFGALLVTLVAATPARAQGDRPVHFNIGGGFTVPVSADADHFSTGGGFNIGMVIEPTPMFGLQVEYGYNGLAGKDRQISVTATPAAAVGTTGSALLSSHHAMQYVDFNGILQTPGDSAIKPYAIGGAGMYYRSVSITTPDVGFATFCDPYWYVCYPAPVSVDRIVGDRSSWDPGIDIGGGLTLAIGHEALFYVETRWHYMWGPSFTDQNGAKQQANGSYFPVTFGFRF